MPKDTRVKICGIKTQAALQSCITYGADFIGFVFYPRSPRAIDIEALKTLSAQTPATIQKVGLFVDPDDQLIRDTAPYLDIIQLHGNETSARCAEIKTLSGKAIMKALAIKTAHDLTQISAYEPICDWLLFDAKPSDDKASLPGGNGLSFDWTILDGQKFTKPWMLAGGLTPENVRTAVNSLHPDGVDVSSGVEALVGEKDDQKIAAFIAAAKAQN